MLRGRQRSWREAGRPTQANKRSRFRVVYGCNERGRQAERTAGLRRRAESSMRNVRRRNPSTNTYTKHTDVLGKQRMETSIKEIMTEAGYKICKGVSQ